MKKKLDLPSITSPWEQERTERIEKDNIKRKAIFSAAAVAFANHGYHETSMEDIASLLSITKPTLYKFYKNKADLLAACQNEALTRFIPAAQAAKKHSGTSVDKLKIYFHHSVENSISDLGKALFVIDRKYMTKDTEGTYNQTRLEIEQIIRDIISDGIKKREISSDFDPKIISLALFGAFNFIPQWFNPEGKLSPDEISDKFFQVFFKGIEQKK